MHDYVMKEKFLAFALAVLGYSIQLYCLGNFFNAKLRHFTMGHFRVPRGLCFKTGVGTRRLIWKSFFILIHSPITFELNRAE